MIQFYSKDIKETGILPESESLHCSRVLRKEIGEIIDVVDGKGGRYKCRITDNHPKKTRVEILEMINESGSESVKKLLAVAPTKSFDRMEWLVEKCIEIGVDEIIFLKCSHSERKDINMDRIERVAVAAMKQSLKSKIPNMVFISGFNTFLEKYKDISQKFVGYCSEEIERKEFAREIKPEKDIIVLIGPEGDFTSEEINSALSKGYEPVTFGESRLRTETAALYALIAVHVINNEHKDGN